IISIRNYYSRSLWRERILFQKIKASYASKNADRTVCVSRTILYDMMDNFGTPAERAEIIYNMYEPAQAINPVQEQYERFLEQKKSASTVFITAGRYVEQKAHRNLIRAFRKVHAAVPGAKLYLFGKGPLKKELQDTINRYGLQDNVFLMDFDPGVVSYLKEADVYVCSSLWEGFSNSLLEALANGLPAVSTDCRSGPRELLAPDTDCRQEAQGIEYAEYGVLVPVCSAGISSEEDLSAEEECLAGAMIRLANDGSMRTAYREKAAERMKSFTPDVIMSQWERLIEKTTGTM
ncbi:MAG: glycosyltransferase, partial [Solobacterium sp.]|nr:glycosyltransferase [Solobacterium sp.]